MKTMLRILCFSLILVVLFQAVSDAQGRRPRRGGGQDLEKPFVGVTVDGKPIKDLFKIESSGVSTQPVVEAAKLFLAGLSESQKKKTIFPVDDLEWRQWDNRHFAKRQGVGFNEMTESQRTLAFGLMRASLSAKGLKLSQDIMKLNHTLGELCNNFEEYGQWLYWITIMGEPSDTKPWGWQIDGHHLVINYFVLGDQVVMSPVFIGSEPIHAKAGKFKGTVILQDEQNRGLNFMKSLTKDQQRAATLAKVKNGNNAVAQAYKDNIVLDYAGLKCDQLTAKQKAKLLSVIKSYVGNMDDGHARVKMSEVEKRLDETYFAWVGETTKESVFYYRIHSPVILIEFDHERRVAPFRSRRPSRDHIHAVVRTPNGNDYGKDLLRQHYEKHHHNKKEHHNQKKNDLPK